MVEDSLKNRFSDLFRDFINMNNSLLGFIGIVLYE